MNSLQAAVEPGSKPWVLAVKMVLLDQEGRCLLIRRSSCCRNFVGKWEWPGGKTDPGEDFATTARRETREETGLETEITGFAGATSFDMPRVHVVMLCVEGRAGAGKVRLSEEHDEFAWVPLEDLRKWPLADQVKHLMCDYAKRRKSELCRPL